MIQDPLEKFLRELERLHQASRMYPAGHTFVADAAAAAARTLRDWGRPVRMSLVGEDLVVEDRSIHDLGGRLKALTGLFRKSGWEGVRILPSCGPSDLLEWMERIRSEGDGPYSRGGITAGRLDLDRGESPKPDRGEWDGTYVEYLPDANQALEQLARVNPEGLDLARRIVRSLTAGHPAAGGGLLASVRRLKEFDEYTYTHALNVAILSLSISRNLGLSGDLTELITLGGLCHDLGKSRVPEGVLNKPGKLDPEEWQIMRQHPAAGAKTLLAIPTGVHPLVPTIACQHHVGVDASGYPELSAERAPHPASLLVQVADVYDALRTIRPYRDPMSETEAVNILIGDANRGKLHRRAVAALADVLNLLVPGTVLRLSDGRAAAVVASSDGGSASPLVETQDGDILDLGDPTMPVLVELVRCPAGAERS